jgi:hypothetical protein
MSSLIADGDPRAIKREQRALRTALIAAIEETRRTRRCFWTWPFGHPYTGRFRTISPFRNVSRCDVCRKPYSWEDADVYDLLREADKAGVPEAVSEPLADRWRALP